MYFYFKLHYSSQSTPLASSTRTRYFARGGIPRDTEDDRPGTVPCAVTSGASEKRQVEEENHPRRCRAIVCDKRNDYDYDVTVIETVHHFMAYILASSYIFTRCNWITNHSSRKAIEDEATQPVLG